MKKSRIIKNLNLLALLCITSYAFSQSLNTDAFITQVTNQQLSKYNKADIKNIKGSPYLNQNFLPVKISKLPERNLSARYNAYNDEIEVKKENNTINFMLNKKSDFSKIQFIASNLSYEACNYTENDENKRGYLERLSPTGNYLLFKKQRVTFIEAKASKTGYDDGTPPEFRKTKDKYFIKINDDDIIELPKNKKGFTKLLPKYKKEILSYFKKENINTKKENDLIKLVKHINTLN